MKIFNNSNFNQVPKSHLKNEVDMRTSVDYANSYLFINKRNTFWYATNKDGRIYSNDGKKFYVSEAQLKKSLAGTYDMINRRKAYWEHWEDKQNFVNGRHWFGNDTEGRRRADSYYENTLKKNYIFDDGVDIVNRLLASGDIIIKTMSV